MLTPFAYFVANNKPFFSMTVNHPPFKVKNVYRQQPFLFKGSYFGSSHDCPIPLNRYKRYRTLVEAVLTVKLLSHDLLLVGDNQVKNFTEFQFQSCTEASFPAC